jgi:hypothetical protein
LHHDASVVLPANGFATAETSTAVQKAPARRAQVEFVCLRVLHTVVSPDRVTRWSYPVKRDSKNDGSLTTYRHSDAKHLENSPARRARDAFVKNFWRWRRIVTSNVASSILSTIPKTCSEACAQVCVALTQIKIFDASSVNQFRCESFRIVYSLSRQRRPRSSDQRGLGNGASVQIGGGVHVGGASTSDVGSKPTAMWER